MAKSIVAGDLNRITEMAWEDRTPFGLLNINLI